MKIGIVIPSLAGHLNPASCLGQALEERGHEVVVICNSDRAADTVTTRGLDFVAANDGEEESDKTIEDQKQLQDLLTELPNLRGIAAWKCTVKIISLTSHGFLESLPSLLIEELFDFLLIDEIDAEAMSVCEAHDIPYGVICNAFPLFLSDPSTPPGLTTWQPPSSKLFGISSLWWMLYRLRNKAMWYYVWDVLGQPLRIANDEYRAKHNLPKLTPQQYGTRGVVYLTQIPSFLDFPRQNMPAQFCHTGPWHWHYHWQNIQDASLKRESRLFDIVPLWQKLDENVPLIYASLGTIQNGDMDIFINLANACRQLEEQENIPTQLVISLGRKGATLDDYPRGQDLKSFCNDSNKVIVIDYVFQLEMIKRSSVLVTHCGQNTALEGLTIGGVPMIAIPNTNGQPGVAARLAHAGVAKIVKPHQASVSNLNVVLHEILTDPSYRQRAKTLQNRIQTDAPSLSQTAKLIERAFREKNQIKDKNGKSIFPRSHPKAIKILGPPPSLDITSSDKPSSSLWKLSPRSTTLAAVAAVVVVGAVSIRRTTK